ncbi:MAG: chorismate synthase [Desulfatiglandales bacterium]
MPGNSFGQAFRVTTFGESHGIALGAVIDGCPPGIGLSPQDFLEPLSRRRPGRGISSSLRKEEDLVEILSGVFEGRTTGCPITLLVKNQDQRPEDYEYLRHIFRPGHGDITYHLKYGLRDHRGGGRASSRETVGRVLAGVVAQKILEPLGVKVVAFTVELAGIKAEERDPEVALQNPFRLGDKRALPLIEKAILEAREAKDSLGGIVEIVAKNVPPGLGEPVFDKLDADLAKAILSVGAVKGVEFGRGFEGARIRGSQNNDPIYRRKGAVGLCPGYLSNNAGGILGGISNGDEIVIRAAIKPIPSIGLRQETIDSQGNPIEIALEGRFDVCAIPRILPVLEAMVSIVLADHWLRQRAILHEPFSSSPAFLSRGKEC